MEVFFSMDNICNLLNFRILYEEIDYINEGKNADRFRRDYRNIKWVRVPVCARETIYIYKFYSKFIWIIFFV